MFQHFFLKNTWYSEFHQTFWRRRRPPTFQETDDLLRDGAGNGKPDFIEWFKHKARSDPSMNAELKQVANGFAYRVMSYNGYDVNGYRFHTTRYEESRTNQRTTNTRVLSKVYHTRILAKPECFRMRAQDIHRTHTEYKYGSQRTQCSK